MDSSSVVVSPAMPKPLSSHSDDDEEDVEYQEIEVEEEIVNEEEFKVEEDNEEEAKVKTKDVKENSEDEIGEELTLSREENQETDMELEDDEEHIQSCPAFQEVSASNPVNDEMHVNGHRICGDSDPNAPFYSSAKSNDALRTPLFGDFDTGDTSGEKDNIGLTNHTKIEALGDTRLLVSQVRSRELSSGAEFDRENKKMKVVCEFHAKGWCIKANSCRFLHINDGLDTEYKKSEVVERQASSSACVLPQRIEGNPKSIYETENTLLRKDDILGTTPLEDCRGSFGYNLNLDKYLAESSSIERNRTYNRNLTSCAVTSHDNYQMARISAFEMTLDETISKKNDYPRPADLPYSHSRQPLYFGSYDTVGTQNILRSGSLKRNISPAPCSESVSSIRNRIFGDVQSDKSKTKSSFNTWEPSVPFRPSHAITQNLLSKKNLYYDTVPERIVRKTDVEDGRAKFPYSDQGSSIKNVNMEQRFLNVGDIKKDNISSSSGDNKLKVDEHRHTTIDAHEAKALKSFHSELIEFVKELVRPTWHEGLLSRDAHKVIVKKSVDKVVSTMQPDQIPSTGESIKLYLSSSRTKLAKLVEAYIEKYGKS